MKTEIVKVTKPTAQFIDVLNRWENDRELIPLIRPNKNQEEFERRETITLDRVRERLEYQEIFQIRVNEKIIGEMNYMVDPPHLFKQEPGTAWIGITIGEPEGRGKGIGFEAIQFLEEQIYQQGFIRIELGVFEFNRKAHQLYQRLGYEEIGRLEDFTFWNGRMWADIRMEKYL